MKRAPLLPHALLWGLWVLLAAVSSGGQAFAGQDGPLRPLSETDLRHVVVLHTNDVHGQVLPRPAIWLRDVNPVPDSGGLPRLAAAIERERRAATEAGAAVFVCDGGDWFQGTPEGQLDRGLAFVRALGAAGHDALVVGNHEFDHGVEVLVQHLAEARLPALLANVRDADGRALAGTRDHLVVERGGVRVAFVGLLTPGTPAITHRSTKELTFEEPSDALRRVRGELPEVDLVIPVTHLGIEDDRALARAHPDLPLIVGGHSHTFLRTGVIEGRTLVVQAGAKASVLGRVDLWLDGYGRVARAEARHLDLYDEPETLRNGAVDGLCADLQARAAGRMDEIVGVLGGALEVTRRELVTCSSGNLITDLVRAHAGADLALQNRGGTRTTLPAGPVSRRDLFMLLPFDNHVETLTMSGADVIELFRRSVEEERKASLEFSGAVLEVRRVEGRPRLERVLIGGEALRPEAELRVAMNSFMAAGGDGWELLGQQERRELDFTLLRDVVEAGFEGSVLVPDTVSRYAVLP